MRSFSVVEQVFVSSVALLPERAHDPDKHRCEAQRGQRKTGPSWQDAAGIARGNGIFIHDPDKPYPQDVPKTGCCCPGISYRN